MRFSLTAGLHRSTASALLAALTSLTSLHAQSALVRPIGGDSIYKLAVDSAAYKEYPFVYLLDDGVVKFEADGSGARTFRQMLIILEKNVRDSRAIWPLNR